MRRYKKRLVMLTDEENKAKKKQKTLRKQNGMSEDEDGRQVREKNLKDYLVGFIRGIGYLLFTIFIFIGLVTLINPGSRSLILDFILSFVGS